MGKCDETQVVSFCLADIIADLIQPIWETIAKFYCL